MGIRGLKTFLEREHQVRPVNITNEIENWKRDNPDQKPIVIMDFMCLVHCSASEQYDVICGGRHKRVLDAWEKMLKVFEATGCSLVFFSDLSIQETKIDEWLRRRDDEFSVYTSIYDSIECGDNLLKITAKNKANTLTITSTFKGMATIAQAYGEFYYALQNECDVEIAQYANRNNAMAILSDDTDFLIFDGSWSLWSAQNVHITFNQLRSIESNRNGLYGICSFSRQQLPLYASLLGNDLTKVYYDQLIPLYKGNKRFINVANYVRKIDCAQLSEMDIQRIVQHTLGYRDEGFEQMIRKSLDSYNTELNPAPIDDPLERKLFNTSMYEPYIENIGNIQGVFMCLYDMRGCKSEDTFPTLLVNWLRRRMGLLRCANKENSTTFLLLTKKNIEQRFKRYNAAVIHPDFPVPPLEVLYLGTRDDFKINEVKWKILKWIMTISDKVISAMKQLPAAFLLQCTTLYSLVKSGLLAEDEADGILITESNKNPNMELRLYHSTVLVTRFVRAAHVYNIAFPYVRHNFAIAGLLSSIQDTLQFDGVYYHKTMEKLASVTGDEHENMIAPIKRYRIYADYD